MCWLSMPIASAVLAGTVAESLDPDGHPFPSQPHVPVLLEAARQQLSAASSPEQKAEIADRIRQSDAFQREMKSDRAQ